MLSHYGLVQVLRVKAYVQGTIRLTRIGKGGTHSVGQETSAVTPLLNMLLGVCSICSQYLIGTFLKTCCTG